MTREELESIVRKNKVSSELPCADDPLLDLLKEIYYEGYCMIRTTIGGLNMIEKESKLSEAYLDKYIEEYLRSHKEELADMLFEPIPELTKEEKDEIQRYFDTSPTWKEKERSVYSCGRCGICPQKRLLNENQ